MEYSKYDAIFLIGPQGCGKGTQGKLLCAKTDFYYWEMGGILREEAKKDTPFGQEIKAQIDSGQLVADLTIIKILKNVLPEIIKHKRVVFDGITRKLDQTQYLVHFLRENGFTVFATILLDLPKEESVKRLLERAHHEFRVDDTEDKILYRLDQYHKDTLPAIEYLKDNSDFFQIDGMGSVEGIAARIDSALGIGTQ